MLALLISLLLFALPTSGTEGTFTALSFGKTTEDYIQFTPADMTPFASSFTSCMWINRQHDAWAPMVLHYLYPGSHNIILGSNGHYNYVNKQFHLTGKFPGKNEWFHYCVTWSRGGTQRVYINGEEVGSTPASSSSLTMGGEICIGQQISSSRSSSHTFGGQLYKLNLFSEVLSSSQIRSMSEAGMCAPVELQFESRTLIWEQILTEQRFGDVTEFVPEECYVNILSNLKAKLNETTSELRKTQDKLLDREARLNRTETKLEETKMQLNNSQKEVEEIKSALLKSEETVNSTQQKLSEVSETLNHTQTELGKTKTHLNLSQSQLAEKEGRLNNTEIELTKARTQLSEMEKKLNESKTRLRESETRLNESETRLNETLSELEGGRKIEEVSRWDVLLTPPYFNKLFTRQLYLQLIGSWDMMGKYYILSFF